MAKADIRSKLSLDGAGFYQGIRKAEGQAAKFGKRLAGMFAGFFAIGMLTRAAQQTIDWGSATSDLALSIGITNEELQELEYAVKKTGGSIETAAKSFKKLSTFRNMALETKGNRYMKISEALGVSREELMALDTPMKLFQRFADIMATKNFGAAQAGIASDLFGRGGMELMPLFIEGLKEMREEARTLGVVVKDDVIKGLDTIKDRQEEIIARLRAPMADALVTVYGWLLKIVEKFNELKIIVSEIPTGMGEFNLGDAAAAAQNMYKTVNRDLKPGELAMGIEGKLLYALGAYVQELKDQTKRAQDKIGEAAGDVLGQKGIEDMAREIAGDVAKQRALRKDAGADFIDALSGEGASKAVKAASFKPPSDALARIGGFVGRGNMRAENYAKQTADSVREVARNTKRTAEALGNGL